MLRSSVWPSSYEEEAAVNPQPYWENSPENLARDKEIARRPVILEGEVSGQAAFNPKQVRWAEPVDEASEHAGNHTGESEWEEAERNYYYNYPPRLPPAGNRLDGGFLGYDTVNETWEPGNEQLLLAGNKDVTIHFELDVGVDLDQEIESFSELSRTGNFRLAKQCFEDKLAEYIQSPYIFLRYAQMLLDSGDYEGISNLNPPFNDVEAGAENDEEYRLERKVWNTMKACYQTHTGQSSILTEVRNGIVWPWRSVLDLERLDSICIQTVCLELQYCAHIMRYYRIATKSLLTAGIHRTLLAQGRVWDWRDISIAASVCDRVSVPKGQTASMPEVHPAKFCDELLAQWMINKSDLLTNLALLDIMTSLALSEPFSATTLARSKEFVDRAQNVVASITEYHPTALKSRQYAQWLLAKVAVSTYHVDDSASQLPGLFIPKEDALDLEVYIPLQFEVPLLRSRFQRSTHTRKIELALSIARQIGDLQTEAMCLKQLVSQSEDPTPAFSELIHLQRTTHDVHGALRTVLAKYLISSHEVLEDHLREEILAIGSCTGLAPTLQWARCMVLRTLARSDEEAEEMLEESKSFYGEVVSEIDMFMEEHGWVSEEMSLHRVEVFEEVSTYMGLSHTEASNNGIAGYGYPSSRSVKPSLGYDRQRKRVAAQKKRPSKSKRTEVLKVQPSPSSSMEVHPSLPSNQDKPAKTKNAETTIQRRERGEPRDIREERIQSTRRTRGRTRSHLDKEIATRGSKREKPKDYQDESRGHGRNGLHDYREESVESRKRERPSQTENSDNNFNVDRKDLTAEVTETKQARPLSQDDIGVQTAKRSGVSRYDGKDIEEAHSTEQEINAAEAFDGKGVTTAGRIGPTYSVSSSTSEGIILGSESASQDSLEATGSYLEQEHRLESIQVELDRSYSRLDAIEVERRLACLDAEEVQLKAHLREQHKNRDKIGPARLGSDAIAEISRNDKSQKIVRSQAPLPAEVEDVVRSENVEEAD